MIILGNSRDDKGTQLEQLTHDLLRAMHYSNIVTNAVGAGGEEIDVRADFRLPGFSGEQSVRIICECKAHKNPVDMTDWLKFLGKILVEDLSTGSHVHGCFIALSGVNGNVAGSHDDLRRRRDNIQLLSGENLSDLTSKLYNVASVETIGEKIRNFTSRQFQSLETTYYNRSLYWIIAFGGGAYTVLNASGDFPSEDQTRNLTSLIEATTSFHPYIDLQVEHESVRRSNLLQRSIIAILMSADGCIDIPNIDVETVLRDNGNYSQGEVDQAILQLIKNELIILDRTQNIIALHDEQNTEDFYEYIVRLYKFLLDDIIVIDILGLEYYTQHINERLLLKICEIQSELTLLDSDMPKVLQLLRLSPRALARSLRPIPIIANQSNRDLLTDKDRLNRNDRNHYLGVLYRSLREDFDTEGLIGYFAQARNIREIETITRTIIKGEKETILDQEIRERIYVGRADEQLGGGFARVLLFDDAPQPWELPHNEENNPQV